MKFPRICNECTELFTAMTDGTHDGGFHFCSHVSANNSLAAGTFFIIVPVHEGGHHVSITFPIDIAAAQQMAADTKAAFDGDALPAGATLQ